MLDVVFGFKQLKCLKRFVVELCNYCGGLSLLARKTCAIEYYLVSNIFIRDGAKDAVARVMLLEIFTYYIYYVL